MLQNQIKGYSLEKNNLLTFNELNTRLPRHMLVFAYKET